MAYLIGQDGTMIPERRVQYIIDGDDDFKWVYFGDNARVLVDSAQVMRMIKAENKAINRCDNF